MQFVGTAASALTQNIIHFEQNWSVNGETAKVLNNNNNNKHFVK